MTLTNTSQEEITRITDLQRAYFASGSTLDYAFRREQLKRFAVALKKWEHPLLDALWTDLHKSEQEAILTELSIVEGEVRNHLHHLRRWMKAERRATPIKMFPATSRIVSEPLGCTLIVSPWNYPVQLLLNPLVGAISAGCTAILKPSPYVPHVSKVIEDMVCECFDERYVAVVQGNREVNRALLEKRFDLIFFTGSPMLGRQVMAAAAKHLTPVVLELGGKSPCIVDREANLELAAKRIAWGKTLNAGQTCIAPDYVMVHKDVKEAFAKALEKAVHTLHGSDVQDSHHFVRMVNDRAYERVKGYMKDGDVVFGGNTDDGERYIEPTLLEHADLMSPVMQEEIFGPVLPMLTFEDTEEVIRFVNGREKPLALYYFGRVHKGREVIRRTSSGGACINDTIMHIVNENIPFGGVGNSGMGCYHGRLSFDAFSHRRSVVTTGTWMDLPFRYMPYRLFGLVKKIL